MPRGASRVVAWGRARPWIVAILLCAAPSVLASAAENSVRTVDGKAVACPDLETWETYHRLAGAGEWVEAAATIAPGLCPDLPAGQIYEVTGGRAQVEAIYEDGRKGRYVFLQIVLSDGTLAWVRESKLVTE